TIE
ncbi:hypothetical protein CISIN_1g0059651mg, partial [Citrus sinensis]